MCPAIACFGSLLIVLAAARPLGLGQRPILALLIASAVALLLTVIGCHKVRRRIRSIDWRISAVVVVTLVSIAVTIAGFELGWATDGADKFLRDSFAGWVASVVFFGANGLVVAIISLARPEEDSFESRAHILFRRQDGKHIEYIVRRIRETLEHYSEEIVDRIEIVQFDVPSQKFLLRTEQQTKVRSYIDDVATSYASCITLEEMTPAPPQGEANRLTYARVGHHLIASKPFGPEGLVEPISTEIEARSACQVNYGLCYWVQSKTEPNSFYPARFTQNKQLTVCNRLPGNEVITIRLKLPKESEKIVNIVGGDEILLYKGSDLEPGKQVYSFYVLPLDQRTV